MAFIVRKLNIFHLTKFFLNKALGSGMVPGANEAISLFYRKKGFNKVYSTNCTNFPLRNRRILDIVTVAFNNEDLIRFQILLLRKNLLDPFNYTVADNSNNPVKRELIKKVCEKEGVGYISLPPNPYNTRLLSQINLSHGVSLNWVYYNYIRPRNAQYMGFLDHDIFPIKPCSLIPILEKISLYGMTLVSNNGRTGQGKKEVWFLWPGLFFGDNEVFREKYVNFMPGRVNGIRVDTGGSNWHAIYSKMKKEEIIPLYRKHKKIVKKNIITDDFIEDLIVTQVEYISDWLHVIRGSDLTRAGEKQEMLKKLLNLS